VGAVAEAIRGEVERAGGRVINEQLGGGKTSWSGTMSLRLPPAGFRGFVDFLEKQGEIQSKRIQASDVSKQLFDQDLALENLTQTMARLQQLLARAGLDMKDVLAIENETTRIRGEIERIKGEQRWLKDRVAYATVEVTLSRKAGVVLGPEAKFFPGGRFAALTLLQPDGRERTRIGGGLTILFPPAKNSPARGGFQFDAFQGPGGESAGFVGTIGVATYSDFLGRGQRQFLNPYLGLRFGYANIHGNNFGVVSGTAGIELYKHEYFMVDASLDAMALMGRSFETALVSGVGAVFAF
jgi:hypothetical protein